MFFERLSAIARTLRFRLMLWNAFAVILTGLGILVSVREGVRVTLVRDLDRILEEDVQEISLGFSEEEGVNWDLLTEELDRKARGHEFHGWFVQFFDASGQTVWSSNNTPNLRGLAAHQGDPLSVGGYRLLVRPLPGADTRAQSVCVGAQQALISRDLARIDRLVLTVFAGVLVAAPLGGYLLAGSATSPLARMIRTTEGLRPTQLGDRLEIRGTGDELDALAARINSLLDRIGDYLRQKHDFLANAAHELRTPLAAVRATVEVALRGKRTPEEYQEQLEQVIDECSALESLVNQLLLLAETDADRLKAYADRVALDQVVAGAVEMFRGAVESRGISLTVSPLPPTPVAGNRHHLRQVINNLLDNAIKFTAAHCDSGRGEITVTFLRDDYRQVARVEVRDNGPGIPPEDLPHVFDRFYRVDRSRSRDEGAAGSGLGLSICQAIVEAHQGQIAVDSTPGKGTTFTITLPLAPQV
ncbi:MAG TPA: HAMP domain-containing sensor histidine kinase [Pirellulaceae bacterium]|nr:HAMP domain-containing sensor histidine kinase [Pirellulaceae bacterium]